MPDTRFFGLKRILYRSAGATIGKNVRICSSAKILGNGSLTIGENTWIGHETMIISSSNILIGKNVDIAPRVYIGTGTHEVDPTGSHSAGQGISKEIIIEDGVWIGVNSTILPGVNIGQKTIIAAGSVVTKSFQKLLVIGGIPAKFIKKLE